MMDDLTCGVDGCTNAHSARGLCGPHWRDAKGSGQLPPRLRRRPQRPMAERFWAYVDQLGDCWVWTGCVNPAGYGRLNVGGKAELAHRMSWRMHKGEIPDGLLVCHRCDNPAHLFLGTIADNASDMVRKGRSVSMLGEASGKARLTWAEVDTMRQRVAAGERQAVVAADFGIAACYLSRIITGKRWGPNPHAYPTVARALGLLRSRTTT